MEKIISLHRLFDTDLLDDMINRLSLSNSIPEDSILYAMKDQISMLNSGPEEGVIVKSNELINAKYHLSLNEHRVVNMAIAMIDRRKSFMTHNEFNIYAQEFADLYSLELFSAYSILKDVAKRLCRCKVVLEDGQELRWVSQAKYIKNEGRILISFSEEIAPHLGWMN